MCAAISAGQTREAWTDFLREWKKGDSLREWEKKDSLREWKREIV